MKNEMVHDEKGRGGGSKAVIEEEGTFLPFRLFGTKISSLFSCCFKCTGVQLELLPALSRVKFWLQVHVDVNSTCLFNEG